MTISWLADKIEQWPTAKLVPYARNARTHSDAQVAQIAASIAEFGFTNPILAGGDGVIVAGHGRLAAAQKLGIATVPVVILDHLTTTQRRALVIADNRIAENAGWDDAMLQVELAALQDDNFDLSLTGFDADALADLLAGEETTTEGDTNEDAVPEDTGPVVSRAGDVWICGEHRVLCGDSTDADAYAALLGDEIADMVFTDPPYNVNYANSAKDKMRGKDRAILNDNLGDGFYDFLLAALTPTVAHCQGGIYVAMSSSELDRLQAAFRAAGGHWSTFVIWAKNTFTLGRADYQRQYEPILYGWPEGADRHWCGDRDQGDVWQIKKPQKNDLHPTMKPVELVERAIRNSSRPGDVVMDPFGGSGTTMIAAHKSGRKARLIELDPKYVDVIVRRWQDYAGAKAIRLSDGVAFDALSVGGELRQESLVADAALRERIQMLWRDWTLDADASGLTDFYGLQALACRAMLEGGEALVRIRYRRPEDGLAVALQLQVLEPEHLPVTMNATAENGNVIRAGIEFDRLGRRVAYHLYRAHPEDGALAPMSGNGGIETVRVDASEILHLFRPLRPGQIRGEPWLARALVKLNELDQYDDAELVRKKTAAMFAGFITRLAPEDNLMGEGVSDANGVALAGLEPGTLQILEPGEDVKFSQPADVGASYADFLRMQFRAVAAAMGVTYEQLTGDLTQVNYSSIRAGLLEFRRRCEALQHGVLVHQLCRPIWQAFIEQAALEGALSLPGYARGGQGKRREYLAVKWIPQGWQWVDPKKEFDAMLTAIRSGLLSRSEAISSFGYDAEDVDREIAADNARADALGLVFESDPRHDLAAAPPAVVPPETPENP